MNAAEFLDDVKRSGNYSEFEKKYREFQLYQSKAIETLKVFHEICEKNNIRYQLAYGSLLGAIRDNGQIPWDYDIDVWVPYSEKEKLISFLSSQLPSDFYFYCPETNPRCRHYMIRIAPFGFSTAALHVDVFYMIGTNPSIQETQISTIKRCINLRYNKLVDIKEEYRGSLKKALSLSARKMQSLVFPLQKIDDTFYRTCDEIPFDSAELAFSTDEDAGKHIFNISKTWSTCLIDTSIGTVRVSQNYDVILKDLYGNYLSIPPIESRMNEVIESIKMFNWFKNLRN